jgi:hypothetical protein
MEKPIRKKRSSIATVGGKQYVSFAQLYRSLAKDISLNTFKGILKANGIECTYAAGGTQWYDLKKAEDTFKQVDDSEI